jgi:heat shock protein HtpX
MIGTVTLPVTLSTLLFTVILSLMGVMNLAALAFLVIIFNVIQWLLAPYLIGALYRTKEVSQHDQPNLHDTINRLSQKLSLKTPKIMIANIPIPNAFAYGLPIASTLVVIIPPYRYRGSDDILILPIFRLATISPSDTMSRSTLLSEARLRSRC